MPFCAVSALVSARNSCSASGKRQRQVQIVVRVVVRRAVEHVRHAERQSAGHASRPGRPAAAHAAAGRVQRRLRHDAGRNCIRSAGVASVQRQVQIRLLSITWPTPSLPVSMSGDSPVTVIVLGHRPERQGDGDVRSAVDLQDDIGLHVGLESRQHHLETIRTDREPGNRERPVRVGDDVALETGVGLRDGDVGARQDAAARISHGAADLGRGALRPGGRSGQDNEQHPTETHALNTRFITPPLQLSRASGSAFSRRKM